MSLWKDYPWVRDGLHKIENRLKYEVNSRHRVIRDILLGLVEAGGKRLRPALVWISGEYSGAPEDKLVPMAAAVEILHMGTLIHDDIIDDADFRRGIETTHRRWDNHTAIFAGDYLFSKVFGLVTDNSIFQDAVRTAKVFRLICEGEIEQYFSRNRVSTSVRKYLSRIRYKTALLFALSCYLGAALGDISDREKTALRNYGLHFGMAFQIQDDILDITASRQQLGKPVANDLSQGIYTLPVIYAVKYSKEREKLLALLKMGQLSEENTCEALEIIKSSGAVEKSRELEHKFIKKAEKDIIVLRDNKYTQVLNYLLEYLSDGYRR